MDNTDVKPAKLRVGESVRFDAHGRTFDVRKITAAEYSMGCVGVTRRRYGVLSEIREDVRHAVEFGCLPPQSGGCW